MPDNKQIKPLGLRFARALQMTLKTAVMFTIDHKSVERPIQQSFLLLNNLLKEIGQFTFGFVENQVMLNNLLTTDPTLKSLETEFLKRGIAGVTFEPGLTLGRYRKIIALLATPTKSIEEMGGVFSFLDQNEIEGARILPAAKNQKKDEHGDTIIESDSEAYILSKQLDPQENNRDFLDSIDALLESGCFDPSARADVLSNLAASGFDGSGYGVPLEVPKLVVVKDGEAVVPAGEANLSAGTPAGSSQGENGSAPRSSAAHVSTEGVSAVPSTGLRAGPATVGAGSGVPGGRFSVAQGAAPGSSVSGSSGSYVMHGSGTLASGSFIDLVEASVQRSLLEDKGDPSRSYVSLARILRNTGVERILEHFPPERRAEVSTLPPEQLAGEYISDKAFQLAGERLKAGNGSSEKILIEEDVLRVLARSLQATQMADRMAEKLSKFIQDFAVPPHMQEKIREELHWSSLTANKKYTRLLELKHYSAIEFRRLMDLLKELVGHRELDRAATLASHYFDFLDAADAQLDGTELSRVPELVRAVPLAQVGFASKTAERLTRTLLRPDVSEFVHAQAATALTVLSQSIAAFEDFQNVLAIGVALEKSQQLDPEKHVKCCIPALKRLLPAAAIERIIEMFLLQRSDAAWSRSATVLLRFAAPASIESVIEYLIKEQEAKNRLALVRLLTQLGRGSIEAACRYLSDERWFVVRNMCGLLADLKDPDLVEHISPALEHADARVQQAALKAIVNSRTVRAAPVLAAALAGLAPKVLDEALDELMFLKHPETIAGLETLISRSNGNVVAAKKAIQVLTCIEDDEALHALRRTFRDETIDARTRRAALQALCKNPSPIAAELLHDLAAMHGPVGELARSEMKKLN